MFRWILTKITIYRVVLIAWHVFSVQKRLPRSSTWSKSVMMKVPLASKYAVASFTKSTRCLFQNWRGETIFFSTCFFLCTSLFLEFGKMQFTFKESHTTQFNGLKTLIQGFYPVRNSGNSKWDWSKLRRLQARQMGYYIWTHQWITSIFGFMKSINEFENLGKWGSAPGKQYLRVACLNPFTPKGCSFDE